MEAIVLEGYRTTDSQTPASHELPKSETGIGGLDKLTKGGLPSGRTTLVLGSPGCGKTILGLGFLAHRLPTAGSPLTTTTTPFMRPATGLC